MNIVFILPSLEKIAPVTVIVNVISFLVKQKEIKIGVMTLQDAPDNNYKSELVAKGVMLYEYSGIKEAYYGEDEAFWSEVDIIHINSLKPNILGYFLQKKYKHLKSLVTIHSVENIDYVQTRGVLKGNISYRLNAFLCKRKDKVVAVSSDVFNYLAWMNISNRVLIYNGIDFKKFKEYTLQKDTQKIHLVQIGVLNRNKNQLYSLRLLKYLVDEGLNVHLDFLGGVKERDYKEKLENYIVENGLEEEVTFHGNVEFQYLTELLSTNALLLRGVASFAFRGIFLWTPCDYLYQWWIKRGEH